MARADRWGAQIPVHYPSDRTVRQKRTGRSLTCYVIWHADFRHYTLDVLRGTWILESLSASPTIDPVFLSRYVSDHHEWFKQAVRLERVS